MRTINFTDDLSEINNRYNYRDEKSFDFVLNNELNYAYFECMLKKLDLETKLEELKKKMENYNNGKIDKDKIEQNKIILKKINDEYYKIKKEAKEHLDYSDGLLTSLEKDYLKNKSKENVAKIYQNICYDIIDRTVKYYIKYEKDLILLVDNFNSINF